ncbi:ATP-dependent DNA helicase PIF1 [Holothuria leucospilota]|uniref:ATP-dependent DNA helicase n=1 Tax=Holothuria leucospilota TaxID=206669 RepID=A0A9Q0YG97_HOLLE|nr:ATP-dependent DNA helicase PIF1 [Holothuria leucospilota]
MVGNKMYIDQRLQQIIGTKKVFGGVSIIAVGDLFQLKPVRDGWIFNDLSIDYGPLASNLWKDHFTAFELTDIMRQKDHQRFAELLNRLREGYQTEEDLILLKTREIPPKNIPLHATHLFQTNKQVNAYNELMFSLLNVPKVEAASHDIVTGDVTKAVKEEIISCIPLDSQQTMGSIRKLSLGVGLRVELCLNVALRIGRYKNAEVLRKQFPLRPAAAKTVHRCQGDTLMEVAVDM